MIVTRRTSGRTSQRPRYCHTDSESHCMWPSRKHSGAFGPNTRVIPLERVWCYELCNRCMTERHTTQLKPRTCVTAASRLARAECCTRRVTRGFNASTVKLNACPYVILQLEFQEVVLEYFRRCISVAQLRSKPVGDLEFRGDYALQLCHPACQLHSLANESLSK